MKDKIEDEKFKKNQVLMYFTCKMISKGDDFPKLQMIDMETNFIKYNLEKRCIDDKELSKKACVLYSQIKSIFADFAKENNIEYERIEDILF